MRTFSILPSVYYDFRFYIHFLFYHEVGGFNDKKLMDDLRAIPRSLNAALWDSNSHPKQCINEIFVDFIGIGISILRARRQNFYV